MIQEIAIPKESLPTKADIKRVKELISGIDADGEKIIKIFKSTAQRYFEIGEILYNWILDYRGKINIKITSDIFGIPTNRVSTGLKIYKLFKDNAELLENLSLQEAMKLLREKSGQNEPHNRIAYEDDENQLELDWEEIFTHKPIAKVKLENYRINAPNENELWLIKRGINNPIKIVDVFVVPTEDDSVKNAHREMIKKIQAATEEFYSVYEKEEPVV